MSARPVILVDDPIQIGVEAVEEFSHCNKCGFCLEVCPTYQQTGSEVASPRGRLSLMEALANHEIGVGGEFQEAMDLCIGCRACETACPSGVKFGRALEAARQTVAEAGEQAKGVKLARKLLLDGMIVHRQRMRRAVIALRAYQKLGIASIVRRLKLHRLLPGSLGEMERSLPMAPALRLRDTFMAAIANSQATGSVQVALFPGCIQDALFLPVHLATVQLLHAAGAAVQYVEGSKCCGALHAHSGDRETAKRLAKETIAAFETTGAELYINNAGGCGAMMKDYPDLLRNEPDWRDRAEAFSGKMVDLSVALGRLPHRLHLRGTGRTVTYQDSCHLVNGQQVTDEPRALLRSVEGDRFVDMPEAQSCCGSGGIYNVLQHEMSMRVLDRKMDCALSTSPNVIVTANPGCTMQMRLGAERTGTSLTTEVVHLAEYLASCLVAG